MRIMLHTEMLSDSAPHCQNECTQNVSCACDESIPLLEARLETPAEVWTVEIDQWDRECEMEKILRLRTGSITFLQVTLLEFWLRSGSLMKAT